MCARGSKFGQVASFLISGLPCGPFSIHIKFKLKIMPPLRGGSFASRAGAAASRQQVRQRLTISGHITCPNLEPCTNANVHLTRPGCRCLRRARAAAMCYAISFRSSDLEHATLDARKSQRALQNTNVKLTPAPPS